MKRSYLVYLGIGVGSLVFAGGTLRAETVARASFENLAQGASPLASVDGAVWANTASCNTGDDLAQRQCRLVREHALAQLATGTLLVEVPDAVALGAWDAAAQELPLTIKPCLACDGVVVDGKSFVVGSETAKPVQVSQPFASEGDASAWRASVGSRLRTQMLVQAPFGAAWSRGGAQGLAVTILGFRVFDACSGAIVAASPSSSPGPKNPAACSAVVETKKPVIVEKLPEKLTVPMVSDAMAPAKTAALACYESFGVAGKVSMRLGINGQGVITSLEQKGDLVGTPTGDCVEAAVKAVTFPRTQQDQIWITYPIIINAQ